MIRNLESILWKLGSKFVPIDTLPDSVIEEEVTCDVNETARKFGLMHQAERTGWKEMKTSILGITKPSRGTLPAKQ